MEYARKKSTVIGIMFLETRSNVKRKVSLDESGSSNCGANVKHKKSVNLIAICTIHILP